MNNMWMLGPVPGFLLGRLCGWLEGSDWPVRPDRHEDRIASAILRAIFVHLYLAWIHPFGGCLARSSPVGQKRDVMSRPKARNPMSSVLT